MSQAIRALEPRLLWNAFADLNAIPRPSKHEEKVRAFLLQFAAKHGLSHEVDAAGNVLIRKPASPDRAGRPTVVLQAHVDMVHKAKDGLHFDFATQGIPMFVEGDWVRADGTTLGADNGLGAAAMLAVLASPELSHPDLEALFTMDEEQGMSGALALQPGLLKGTLLLNLDSEEDDTFTIGCAGGLDTLVSWTYATKTPSNAHLHEIKVEGLKGGHSGLQIHEGRGNAIKLMARLLSAFDAESVALCQWRGGSARNAIPARSEALVAIPESHRDAFEATFHQETQTLLAEWKSIEPDLRFRLNPVEKAAVPGLPSLVPDEQAKLLLAMRSVVNGVYRMSPEIPGLVEASSNLSLIDLRDGQATWSGLQRSSVESSKQDVATAFAAPFRLLGAEVTHDAGYPGWKPSAASPILDLMKKVYAELFAEPVQVAACHAGLECGVIAKSYPEMDMISFGPNILEAHSEKERASIRSTQKFWTLLTTTLAQIH